MKKYHISILVLLVVLTASMVGGCASQNLEQDLFMQIAKIGFADVPGLQENPIPKLPNNELAWDAEVSDKVQTINKIDTQEELEAELVRMRAKYKPFLQDIAPKMEERLQHEFYSFDWRMAEKSEWKNDAEAIAGKGEWIDQKIPHYDGPIGDAYSYYRKEVELDAAWMEKDRIFMHFQGVDYYTWLYVNGELAGYHEGLFDAFEFDIRPLVKEGKNTILVKVGNTGSHIGTTSPLYPGVKTVGNKFAANGSPGWDDPYNGWINTPAGMGLWQRCWLEGRNDVFVNDLFVRPILAEEKAEVRVEVGMDASLLASVDGLSAQFSLFGQNFKRTVYDKVAVIPEWKEKNVNIFMSPQPEGTKASNYIVREFSFFIDLKDPKVWNHETPYLYQMQMSLLEDGKVVDSKKQQFGMRSFTQDDNSYPKGRYYLNGDEIRLRGANMMGNIMQCVIRRDYDQLIDDILLAKIANMNFWRMTQQPCQPIAFEYFDKLGLLAQADLPTFSYIPRAQEAELYRQICVLHRHVRRYPSNAQISFINEPMFHSLPGRDLPRLDIPETGLVFADAEVRGREINPDQVVKWVDGDYANMNPEYPDHHTYSLWYWKHAIEFNKHYKGAWCKTREGWMHGCGEYGIEGLDSYEVMTKYYPKEWLGIQEDGSWNFKALPSQTPKDEFRRWIGQPKTMQDAIKQSRMHQQVGIRLQTEAFRRDPKNNSLAIHLLICAWPASWVKTVIDVDRVAKPAYYEFKDALAPIAVNLRPDAFYGVSGEVNKTGLWICNDTATPTDGYTANYRVTTADGVVLKTGSSAVTGKICKPNFQGWLNFQLPKVEKETQLTLTVSLTDEKGNYVHDKSVGITVYPTKAEVEAIRKTGKTPGSWFQYLIES